ncbi:hypothetical protein QOZ80_8BG0644060 [Eleusine coracana subsp. coracana]|nr:hypothetical protein QOZ80_8BG0644060 [Eleusine coracana subsp. coracana]
MAATTTDAEKQRQGDSRKAAALFEPKHGELASEAHAVARELGVDVTTVAFRPGGGGGGAVSHEFLGVAPAERVRRLVETDVSAMGPAELAQHAARLRAVRAALVSRMQGTEKKEKQGVVGGEVVEVVERAPGKKEMPNAAATGEGSKILAG